MDLALEADTRGDDGIIAGQALRIRAIVEPENPDTEGPFGIGDGAKREDVPGLHEAAPVGDVLLHELAFRRGHVSRKGRARGMSLKKK